MTRREAILTGARAAVRLHQDSRTEDELRITRGPVDVFGSLLKNHAALLFRPLEGLLGVCLPGPTPGVLISTKRPLPVQRFTGAHELGHIVMHHDASLDGDEIIEQATEFEDMREVQANAFASEFLIPSWLLAIHGRAQGWNRDSLRDPAVVYQLSLRVGASYEATCFALSTYNFIDSRTLSALRAVARKTIKQTLLPDYAPEHWHRDIWLLTKRDEGAVLLGQPDDLFLFRLCEKSGAGYLWDIEELRKQGFLILRDKRNLDSGGRVGADVERTIAAQSSESKVGKISLTQKRPWQRAELPVDELHVGYDLRGKETEGFSRAARRQFQTV